MELPPCTHSNKKVAKPIENKRHNSFFHGLSTEAMVTFCISGDSFSMLTRGKERVSFSLQHSHPTDHLNQLSHTQKPRFARSSREMTHIWSILLYGQQHPRSVYNVQCADIWD